MGKGYTLYRGSIDILAYADDLTFVSETPGLQAMLDTAGRIATWAGLSFNPKKCATLYIDGKKREAPPTHFRIQKVPHRPSLQQKYTNSLGY
jgi:hypothetical protein